MVDTDAGSVVISVNGQVPDGEDLSWLWDVNFEHFVDHPVVAAGERGTDLAVRLGYAGVEHTLVHNAVEAITSCPQGHVEVVANYTAFLQHVGVPSMNLGFGGEDQGGVYHSVYDDFYWYTHFSDTSFVYGRALAQTVGTAAMRLADADVIPYDFTDLAETVNGYVGELKALHKGMASEAVEHNREVADSTFFLTNDPRDPLALPKAEGVVPDLDFAPLDSAAAALTRAAARYQTAFNQSMDGAATESFIKLNSDLLQSERLLLSDAGLPNRPWFKHLLYAPGYYTGYGVKTIPGVREAIEQKEWSLAGTQIAHVASALNAEAALVDRAAADLGH